MVMKPEPWGEALDALLPRRPARPTLVVPTPCRRAVHPGRWPASSPAASTWSSRAGATRASTSGCSTTPRPAPRCARSRSATTCSTGERWPRWRSSRPSSGCCPGFMGNPESLAEESHEDGLLEYPVYTKPATWRGHDVPAGAALRRPRARSPAWRHEQAVRRTAERRPDLAAPRGAVGSATLDGSTCRLASRRDAGELFTLQRACWVQEPQANPGVDDPGARRVARRRAGLARASGRPAWPAAAAGWSAPCAAVLDGRRRLGHRPADGRPRPAGPRPGPAACSSRVEAAAPAAATSYALFTGAGSARNLRMYKKAGYRLAGSSAAARRGAR